MKSAADLFLAYIAAGPAEAAELFAEDGSIEIPYLADIGLDPVCRGKENVRQFLTFLHTKIYPNFRFDDVKVHIANPDQIFAEYHINETSGLSGRHIHQHVFGLFEVKNGKIQTLTEAVNLFAAAEAIYPGGVAEVINRDRA